MSLNLDGSWENSYGSIMTLSVDEEGVITGEYTSHTGSTGTYLIIGHCRPNNPIAEAGQPLVLSIFWRSIGGEKPDDGSHFVSTYCGQLDNKGQMTVINSLVTTVAFQEFIPGDYIDKLSFNKQVVTKKGCDKSSSLFSELKGNVSNVMNGIWSDSEQNIQLALSVKNYEYGLVEGRLFYDNELIKMFGFTDTHSDGEILQSITLSGYIASNKKPISLVGRMTQDNKRLILSRWLANSTSPEDSYFQSNSANWTLDREL